MKPTVLGIHHVTAISGDPQQTVDFYAGLLGLRLVKKTVNFDDPGTYHLYFGNGQGEPGTLITFFPWGTRGLQGRIGNGQVSVTSYSVPAGSLDFWKKRLQGAGVTVGGPGDRFDETFLSFEDSDGLRIELVEVAESKEIRKPWAAHEIPAEFGIAGIHSVTLSEEGYERTGGLLVETLGFNPAGEKGNVFRYQVDKGMSGQIVQIECNPKVRIGQMGVGAVHHVAWRAKDDDVQLYFQDELSKLGYGVTPVVDRQYFKSIYFREPGQVLFEIATDPPGMLIDESYDGLGTQLKLPPWHEKYRGHLEETLAPLQVPEPVKRLER